MSAFLLIFFTGFCLVLAAALPLARNLEFCAFLSELPETVRAWLHQFFLPDLNKRVLYADEVHLKMLIRPDRANHWRDGAAKVVRLCRIDVPIGCVAVLGVQTADGQRVLEQGAFCTFDDLAQDEIPVALVQKSCRWQALIKEVLTTKDSAAANGGLRFHVAVHTTMPDGEHTEGLEMLSAECESYIESVHNWLRQTLGAILGELTYDQVTRDTPALLDRLNALWANEEYVVLPQLASVLKTEFTGLIPKLLQYAEDARYQAIHARPEKVQLKSEEIITKYAAKGNDLGIRHASLVGSLKLKFMHITGLTLKEGGGRLLPEQSTNQLSLSQEMDEMFKAAIDVSTLNSPQRAQSLTATYVSAKEKIRERMTSFTESIRDLATLIKELKQEELALIEQGSTAESDVPSPPPTPAGKPY